MFNITNHQGNVNQNHTEISPIPTKWIIKKTRNNKCWRGCGIKGTFCWWEWKLVQPLLKMVWRFLKEIKMELPYDPAITLPLPKEYKNTNSKRCAHPNVYSSTIYNSQIMETAQGAIYTHTHICMEYVMEYYSAIKKNEMLTSAMMWVELESIMLSEISQSEKDKYHMVSFICGI